MQCFKNGRPVTQVEVLDRAFHYGDGCFTTAQWNVDKLYLQHWHQMRLEKSAQALLLEPDWSSLQQSFAQFEADYGTVKIMISRGVGQRGYALPAQAADVWVFFYPQMQAPAYDYQLIKSGVLQQRIGLSMPQMLGVKSLNRLEQVLLKAEAQQLGFSEALVCDVADRIVEGISSNCFFKIAGQWISPNLIYNGVHGVMRQEILARMQQNQIPCILREVNHSEIEQIQSLFFCNALHPMTIVTHLDGRVLDDGACRDLFSQLHLDQLD